jgi:phage gp45-like
MSWLGSVPSTQFVVNAASTTVTATATAPLAITGVGGLPGSVMSIEIIGRLSGDAELLAGPDGNLQRICLLPAGNSSTYHAQRQPIALAKGTRLSVRSLATAITTGTLYINLWT